MEVKNIFMETNLLVAFLNLIKNPVNDIVRHYISSNRANNMGDSLEYYVKDLFCGQVGIDNINKINHIYSNNFSYIGNQNNPPDIIIRNGDAIEVKKIESLRSGIALNSSYPKSKLYADSPMITRACKNCEEWEEKDIIYSIGVCQNNKLKVLWFVYGNCYAANKEIYEKIRNKISNGVNELQNVEFAKTKELGRVNKVDPLGITFLRVRGMWQIENPVKVFSYVTSIEEAREFNANAIILKEKYLSFPDNDRKKLEREMSENFTIADIKIKSPDNPAKLLDAKLLRFIK